MLSFVYFIWGILCLILFFKIWGAANNLARIRRILEKGDKVYVANTAQEPVKAFFEGQHVRSKSSGAEFIVTSCGEKSVWVRPVSGFDSTPTLANPEDFEPV